METFENDGMPHLTPLEEVADALLEAHRHATIDGDARLKHLVEEVLIHVGRRLALAASVSHGVGAN